MVIILISAMNKQYVLLVIRMEVMLINYVISSFFNGWFFPESSIIATEHFCGKREDDEEWEM